MSKFINLLNGTVENPPSATMDKELLKQQSKVSSSPFFSSESNWKLASFIYKKAGTNTHLPVSFRSFSAAKTIKLKPGMVNGDNFELVKVIISDVNRNLLVLKSSDISDLASYNFALSGSAPPPSVATGFQLTPAPSVVYNSATSQNSISVTLNGAAQGYWIGVLGQFEDPVFDGPSGVPGTIYEITDNSLSHSWSYSRARMPGTKYKLALYTGVPLDGSVNYVEGSAILVNITDYSAPAPAPSAGFTISTFTADASVQIGGMLNVNATLLDNGSIASGLLPGFVEVFASQNTMLPTLISMPAMFNNGVLNFPLPIMASPDSPMYLAPGTYYVRVRHGMMAISSMLSFTVNDVAAVLLRSGTGETAMDWTGSYSSYQGIAFKSSATVIPGTNQRLDSIKINMRKADEVPNVGFIRLKLYYPDSTGGFLTGEAQWTSSMYDLSQLSTSFQDVQFNFSSLPMLMAGTIYHFAAEFVDSTGALIGNAGATVKFNSTATGDIESNSLYYQHQKSGASATGYEYILKSEVWIKNV